jgi:hypothetical protein
MTNKSPFSAILSTSPLKFSKSFTTKILSTLPLRLGSKRRAWLGLAVAGDRIANFIPTESGDRIGDTRILSLKF